MKKLLVSKIMKNQLPVIVDDLDVMNIIFTDSNELYINKIDGTLLKISDINIIPTLDAMHKIPNPKTNILYVCIDDKSINIWDGAKFVMLSGGDRDVLLALKQQLDTHINTYDAFILQNNIVIPEIQKDIQDITSAISAMEVSVSSSFIQVNEVLDTLCQEMVNVKDSVADVTAICQNNTNSIQSIDTAISTINTDIITINNSILDITNKLESLEVSYDSMRTELDVVIEDTRVIKNYIKEKLYNVEFNIVDKLSALEVLDTIDLETLIFDTSQHVSVQSITLKTTVLPVGFIEAEINYRVVSDTGVITDRVVGVIGLNPGQMNNSILITNPLEYSSGILVAKITNDGNMHDNLRIIVKIKRVQTT